MTKSPVGLVGLGVMGANLAQNIASREYPLVVHNRSFNRTQEVVKEIGEEKVMGVETLAELVAELPAPRTIILMVPAGAPVDLVLDELLPELSSGDLVLDGGNSYFRDTEKRTARCESKGVHFLGVGISGGAKGAREGACIMPGGDLEAWSTVRELLESIAADEGGPCTAYIGPGGAGHFVKMVHNGIEYGDMQMIAEAYELLKEGIDAAPRELAQIFADWNTGELNSFLIEITAKIFKVRDPESEDFLIDRILDKAGQKGTGRWTVQEALELGVAIPTITSAVDTRILSSHKALRVELGGKLPLARERSVSVDKEEWIARVRQALFAGRVLCYAQGMQMLAAASDAYQWSLNLSEIASIWRGGCIIRSKFLEEIRRSFAADPELPNLVFDPELRPVLVECVGMLRSVIAEAVALEIPVPALASALGYFDTMRCAVLPTNLIQAQRDFFGGHTFQRTDGPESYHHNWEGE